MAAGELLDEHGNVIAEIPVESMDVERRPAAPRLGAPRAPATPSPTPPIPRRIPPWGWVAIVAAVGAGAYALLSADGSLAWGDDDDADGDVDLADDEAA